MTNLQEVPTDELLSFHEYPTVHTSSSPPLESDGAQINVNITDETYEKSVPKRTNNPQFDDDPPTEPLKSFWTLEYYQKFFDVDTKDVTERILASVTPKRTTSLKQHLQKKPDLYGPFWISVTLIFTIAISGNIANYFQHVNAQYHWQYDFHLVSYAATTICLYVTLVPMILWALLKWSSDVNDLDGLEDAAPPSALELICLYGYSLFVYIPVSILWTIQVNLLQWTLVLVAACLSGSVIFLTLLPSLKLSRHRLLLTVGIISLHLLLTVGFKMYFFNNSAVTPPPIVLNPVNNVIHANNSI